MWLGRPDQPESYQGQPGGIGTISKLLAEWKEVYDALVALDAARGGR